MNYGCIGEHLPHSFSREIHEQIGSYAYELKELTPDELPGFLAARDFRGINVTIPYKQAVIPALDEIDETAREIGAVNTIVRRDGRLLGYNTDLCGLTRLIRRIGLDPAGKKVLILIDSATTGGTLLTALNSVRFYQGEIVGISAVFSVATQIDNIPIRALFTKRDFPEYASYTYDSCPLCRDGAPVDAICNGYGYSTV